MIRVVVQGLNSNDISALVHELRDLGYKVGQDFNFEFATGRYDWQSNQQIPPRTVFYWINETAGTWFALKYC